MRTAEPEEFCIAGGIVFQNMMWILIGFLLLLWIRETVSLVCSALKGELRSKTKEPFRGKGLPYIFETCAKKQIQNMRIITDKADVTIHGEEFDAMDRENSLRGTLFYWQIDLQRLTEEDC